MVSHRGIEDNPNKFWAIQEMNPLKMIKKVQHLLGKVAALNRFVSKLAGAFPSFRFSSGRRTSMDHKGLEGIRGVEKIS